MALLLNYKYLLLRKVELIGYELMKNKKLISLLLISGIIVLVNILAYRFYIRIDFTADSKYTLSKATQNVLDSLKEPVTINAYFSQNLPPDAALIRTDFKNMLTEYNRRSRNLVMFEFLDPAADSVIEKEALSVGVFPLMLNLREKDQMVQQKAFMGAFLQLGQRSDVIPYIRPEINLEYSLTSMLRKLSIHKKKNIGFLQGNGEPSANLLQQLFKSLSIQYNLMPVDFNDSITNFNQINTLVIIAPTDSISDAHFQKLDQFLSSGKNIFIAMNCVKTDFVKNTAIAIDTKLEKWLATKGITIEKSLIIDKNCGNIILSNLPGNEGKQVPVTFPFLPVITNFAEHQITFGLEKLMLQFASPIFYKGSNNFLPLAVSSQQSGTLKVPLSFDYSKIWKSPDFNQSYLTVAGLLNGRLAGTKYSQLIVLGDADFIIGSLTERELPDDNINFVINCIDYLSEDTNLIGLRTKTVNDRSIRAMDEVTKMSIKYFNLLFPIAAIIGFGVIRFQIRLRRRNLLKK